MSHELSLDAPPQARAWPARQDLVIAAAIAAVVFGGNYAIERNLERHGVLRQYDVLFNADPPSRLISISNGKGDPNDLIIHPGFKLYFSRAIRVAGKVARTTGLIRNRGRDEHDLRQALALLVVPAVSGTTMATAYLLLLAAGLPRPKALVMALVCAGSFSQMVFGSVPDHMPLSGLLVTVLLLMACELVHNGGRVRRVAWPVVGGLYAGVTVTNAAPFTLLFTTALAFSGRPARQVAREAVGGVAGMLAVVGVIAVSGRVVDRETPWPVRNVGHHATSYLKWEPRNAPAAMLDTFAPSGLVRVPMPETIRKCNIAMSGRYIPGIATAPAPCETRAALFAALTVLGALGCVRAGGPLRALGLASLGVVAFHLALHSVWGDSFFLYSQHWLVPLAVLLAGNLSRPGWAGCAFTASYAAGAVAMFVHNGALLNQILTAIATAAG